MYESAAIPFQSLGNYSVITDEQLLEMPWLGDFVERFPHCFERDEMRRLSVFWPDGQPNRRG